MPRLTEPELDLMPEADPPHDGIAHDRTRQKHADRRTKRRMQRHAAAWDDLDEPNDPMAARKRPARRHRDDGRETFRCRHCRALVGPTVSGGRHRNHCPLCLYSRHVDDRRPGDRASTCRSLMAPVGTFFRPKGEQVIVHRCLGCGLERFNRVAADDNDLALMRLPLVPPRSAKRGEVIVAPESETATMVDEREAG